MKNIKILLAVLFLCLGMATMGWCLSIVGGSWAGTDVGAIDSLMTTTDTIGNSGDATETAWVNSILGSGTVTFSVKNEDVTLYNTDGAGVYAFNMPTPPESEYFLVKNSGWHALFANLVAMDWGVIASNMLPGGMKLPGDFEISHVTRFDGDGTTPVPEPATILLLGMGLLGLVAAGKKRVFKK